jgi:hypothetical protein
MPLVFSNTIPTRGCEWIGLCKHQLTGLSVTLLNPWPQRDDLPDEEFPISVSKLVGHVAYFAQPEAGGAA